MKSYIKSLYNYMDVPLEDMTQIITGEEMEESLRDDIRTTLLEHKSFADVPTVEKGDVVVLSAESAIPRLNKPAITLTVGLNLFHGELEEKLPGRRVNEPFTVTVGESPVSVVIKSCQRLSVPALDDAFVRSLGVEGVDTVSRYKAHLTAKYLDFYQVNYVSWYATQLFAAACDRSDWDIDPAESEQLYGDWKKREEERRAFHGVSIAENYDGELEEMERQDALYMLRLYAVHCLLCGEDYRTVAIDVSDDEKHESIRQTVMKPLENYLRDKVKVKLEEEE